MNGMNVLTQTQLSNVDVFKKKLKAEIDTLLKKQK